MAVSWWVATGTNIKMERDVLDSTAGANWKQAFWIRKNTAGNVPLKIDHVVTPLIMLGVGLMAATVSFLLELLHHICLARSKRSKSSMEE